MEFNHDQPKNQQDKKQYTAAVQAIAQEAAERAVVTILLRMGVDPDDRDGLKRLRDNLTFLARMNRGADQVGSIVAKTCAGAAVMAFLWMLGAGFKDWLQVLLGMGSATH